MIPILGMSSGPRYGYNNGTSTVIYAGETGSAPICSLGRPAFSPVPEIKWTNSGTDYGFAADYIPNCTVADKNVVYAPALPSSGVTGWRITTIFKAYGGRGCGVVMRSEGGTISYTLVLMHLAYTGADSCLGYSGTRAVGEAVGYLLDAGAPAGWGPHVHIELMEGSTTVKPATRF